MHESLHEADFLLVALRVLPKLLVQVKLQAAREPRDILWLHAAPQVAQVSKYLPPRHVVPKGQLAGQIAHQPLDLDAIVPHVFAEDPGPAAGRPYQVHQYADSGSLTRAVRPQEPEHFALAHGQVQVDYAPVRTVILGKLLGLDSRSRSCRRSLRRLALPARYGHSGWGFR